MRLFYLVNLAQLLSTSMIISESQSLFHKETRPEEKGMSTKSCQSPFFCWSNLRQNNKEIFWGNFCFLPFSLFHIRMLTSLHFFIFSLWGFKIGFLWIYAYRFRTIVWKIGFITILWKILKYTCQMLISWIIETTVICLD